jgi:radical SAM superfamily enzyme YgiQ (UPF0313 family)
MNVWVLNPPFLPKFSRPQRSPAVTKSGTTYFPIWLAYATGVLEAAGHQVTLTDAAVRSTPLAAVLAEAPRLRPDLIVMDTSTPSIANDLDVAAALKQVCPGVAIVLVGTHVTACAEETLAGGLAADAVARREYDYTLRDLAAVMAENGNRWPNAARLAGVAGLSFRADGRVVHNPDRPYIENLDELPWVSRVYRRHLNIRDYFNQNALYPMVTLITSRGCLSRCNFCLYPQVLTGRRCRVRSIRDVVDEMAYVAQEFPEARSIFFEDDTLTVQKSRCLELAEAIGKRNLTIPWQANSRVDVDNETLQRIRAAGCRELCVGFESGSQAVLNRMHKGTRTEQMQVFMQNARRAGLLVHGCFMFGFPDETPDDVQLTMDLALRLNPDTAQFYPVMVYPGTEAYEEFQSRGWLSAASYRDWLTADGLHNCVIRNHHMTAADLVNLCDRARRTFYLRPRYIIYKLGQLARHPSDWRRTAKAARVFIRHLVRGSRVQARGTASDRT